ncbi:hypothetical protein Tco_1581687 [Tanacetum coccineum]
MLKNFLWNQGEIGNGKAKIAWSTIYRPKDQGRLGLKDIQKWNETLLVKHVWNILKLIQNDSWGWRNLLEIKDKIKRFVFYKIGDGCTISFWYDNWNSIGPINNYVTHMNRYDARLADNMKVCDMVKDGK